jgi:hypothetical protein
MSVYESPLREALIIGEDKNYSKISNLEPYKLICLTLLLSLTVGIHGLSHLGLETKYNFLI